MCAACCGGNLLSPLGLTVKAETFPPLKQTKRTRRKRRRQVDGASGASLLVSHGTILSVSLAGQGVCVETGAASSRSPGLLPPSGLMSVRRHKCSSNFPTQNQTSGVCLPLRDAAGPGSSHIRAPPREGMHREKFHFIYFPFSPFPDLLCYIIQKMVQMGKPLALRQEAGGRGHGTQPLALGRNRPPSLLPHTSTRGGTAGTLLRRRGQPADPGPPGLTLAPSPL